MFVFVSQSRSEKQLKESVQKFIITAGRGRAGADLGCDVSIAVPVLRAHGVVWEGQARAQIWLQLLPQTAECAAGAQPQSHCCALSFLLHSHKVPCPHFPSSLWCQRFGKWECWLELLLLHIFSPTCSSVPGVVGLPAWAPWQPCWGC